MSSTTSKRLKFRSKSHIQVTRTRKTFQTFANRGGGCAEVSHEKAGIDWEPSGKGAIRILHLCLRKINKKLAPRSPASSRTWHFYAGASSYRFHCVLLRLREPNSQELITVMGRSVPF